MILNILKTLRKSKNFDSTGGASPLPYEYFYNSSQPHINCKYQTFLILNTFSVSQNIANFHHTCLACSSRCIEPLFPQPLQNHTTPLPSPPQFKITATGKARMLVTVAQSRYARMHIVSHTKSLHDAVTKNG